MVRGPRGHLECAAAGHSLRVVSSAAQSKEVADIVAVLEANTALSGTYALARPLPGGFQSGAWLIEDKTGRQAVLLAYCLVHVFLDLARFMQRSPLPAVILQADRRTASLRTRLRLVSRLLT